MASMNMCIHYTAIKQQLFIYMYIIRRKKRKRERYYSINLGERIFDFWHIQHRHQVWIIILYFHRGSWPAKIQPQKSPMCRQVSVACRARFRRLKQFILVVETLSIDQTPG